MRNWIDIIEEGRSSPARRYIEKMDQFVRGMPYGFRASLDAEDDDEVSIQRIYTDPNGRRTGLATEYMSAAIKLADRLGISLYLEALPEGDESDLISLESLVAFYVRFGFEGTINGDSAMMSRQPK